MEGDDNGDGVLNFQEFLDIVSKIAPHFPKRRILRMFREALTQGTDDDRINDKAFVNVCKAHGLGQLVRIRSLPSYYRGKMNYIYQVDINSLKKNALAALTPQVTVAKKENKTLKSYAGMMLKKQGNKGGVAKSKLSMAQVILLLHNIINESDTLYIHHITNIRWYKRLFLWIE